MNKPTRLSELATRQSAMIGTISGHPSLRSRLHELGFTPGATVRLVARAAFGGALACQVRGSTIALRKADAWCVELQA